MIYSANTEDKVTLRSSCLFIGLMAGLSVVASASAIHTAMSSYGSPTSGGIPCVGLCTFPPGVTVLEQNYAYSGGGGEVYDFDISSLPSGITGFTVNLGGSAPFLNDSTDLGQSFGAFVCPLGTSQCGPDPSSFTTASTDSASLASPNTTVDAVQFKISGNHPGLVFYAIVPNPVGAIGTVTADIQISTATPEPRLFPILGLAFVGLLVWRRRLAKLA